MVKVECPACAAPYSVSDKRIPDGGLKMRCPKCGESFLVQKGGAAHGAEVAPPPQPAPRRQAAQTMKGHLGEAGGALRGPAIPPPRNLESIGAPIPPISKRPLFGGAPASPFDIPAPPHGLAGDDGFGVLELPLPAPAGGGADLPTTAGPADLPVAAGGAVRTMPVGSPELPLPADPAGLPIALEHNLPMAADGSNLPMPAGGSDLPIALDHSDLPMPAGGSNLPMAAGGSNLPMAAGGSNLPMAAGGSNLPMPAGHNNLPMPAGHADLPVRSGHGDLPMPGDHRLPALHGGGNLPVPAGIDLPLPHLNDALPVPGDLDLPLPSGFDNLPLPGDSDLPAPAAGQDSPFALETRPPGPAAPPGPPPARGSSGLAPPPADADFDEPLTAQEAELNEEDEDFLSGGQFPSESPDQGDDGFDAFDADLASVPPSGHQASEAPEADEGAEAAAPPRKQGDAVGDEFAIDEAEHAGDDAPLDAEGEGGPQRVKLKKKRSNAMRVILAAIPVAAIGGGLLGLTDLGPYGAYAIGDALNRETYTHDLDNFRKLAMTTLDADTASEARQLLKRANQEHRARTRHVDTTAYAAYLSFASSLRFGSNSETIAGGRQLLARLPKGGKSLLIDLAHAAQKAASGQLGPAKAQVTPLLKRQPDDVDLASLAGEIALATKSYPDALAIWEQAAKTHRSARTLYGIARSQLALGKFPEAQRAAAETLKLSADHAGARTLSAHALWRQDRKNAEAIKLLEEVTTKGAVREAASTLELVTAFSLLGDIYLLRSRITNADGAFKEALKLDPRSQRALIGSGEVFYRAGRFSEALARYEAAHRVNAKNEIAAIGRAKAKLALERAKEAQTDLAALYKTSDNPLVGYWLGQAMESLGERQKAEKTYRETIKKAGTNPDVVSPYVALADLLNARGDTEGAASVLSEAGEKLPDSIALHNARGDVALKAGRLQVAKREFSAALDREPDNTSSRFRLGIAHRRAREFDAAKTQLDLVTRSDPEFPGLALERGLLFEETGETDKALAMYADALKKAPQDIDLKLRVGSTQVVSGHPKQALPLLREVLGKRPQSAEVNHFLGRALLMLGEPPQEALGYLKIAVQYDPNRAIYHLYVAWAANESRQPGLASDAIDKTLALDAEMGDAYWQRGVLLQKRSQTLDALEQLQIALAKNPSRYQAYATMARCYQDQSDAKSAEAAWRKAIEGDGEVAEWHFRLGKLLSDRHATKEAAEHLEKSIALVSTQKRAPGWLWNANILLGEALRRTDKKRALVAYKEFMRLSNAENAYRREAQDALDQLEREVGTLR